MTSPVRSEVQFGPTSSYVPSPPFAPDEPVLLVGGGQWWKDGGLEPSLAGSGWTWITAETVERARWLASIRDVSLIVVAGDRAFRREAIAALRDLDAAPLVVVADEPDDVVGLIDAGVDLVVPGSEPGATMLARLFALVRRADPTHGPGVRYLQASDLVVDLWTQRCTRGGAEIALSPTEYRLLTFLMAGPAVTMPTSTIIGRVWRYPPADGRNALRIVVNRLRHKLGDEPRSPAFIASIRGSGYRFVANVVEVADSLDDHVARVEVTPLLESLTTFAEHLAGVDEVGAAADLLAETLDRAALADGLAVFRNEGERMRLIAARRLPTQWLESVADGVPLDPSFASAQSVLIGEVVQFADVRAVKGRFGATARQLTSVGFRACHFVPIRRDGRTWGHVGLGRRSPSPVDAVTMAYLQALCATFLLYVDF